MTVARYAVVVVAVITISTHMADVARVTFFTLAAGQETFTCIKSKERVKKFLSNMFS